MRRMTSSEGKQTFRGKKIVVIFILLIGIIFLLFVGRTSIMRLIAKNPKAFEFALKGKAFLAKLGFDSSSNGQRKNPIQQPQIPAMVDISIDLAASKGSYKKFWGGIGYNSFKVGSLDPRNQKLFQAMAEVNRKNPGTFTHIRAFNIFSNGDAINQYGEGCEIYSEDHMGKPIFQWTTCDMVFDRIVSYGFDVIVDFTLMPIELASNKQRMQPWFGANMSPPLSHEKWANLVYETTRHLVERYGWERVSRWCFEIWNEPDLAWLFWVPDEDNPNPRLREWGDMDAYNKLYDYTVAAVKRVHPKLRVGGPAVAGAYIEPFLEHIDAKNYATGKKGTDVDFLSFHSYGSVFEKVIHKIHDIHQTAGKIKVNHQRLPLVVSEFSPSAYDLPWYVTRYPALWLIATVDAIFNYADQSGRPDFLPEMMVYWTSPVIKDFGKDPVQTKTDGLATTLGPTNYFLKLPVFNAYEMLGNLSHERVAITSSFPFPNFQQNLENEFIHLLSAMATKSDTSFEVLVYQFTENDAFSKNVKTYSINLNIQNICNDRYYVRKYRIGASESNGYAAWQQMKSPMAPDESQLKMLDHQDDLKLLEPVYQPEFQLRSYREQVTLKTNEALLLTFSKVKDGLAPQPVTQLIKKQAGERDVVLQWQAPDAARDGDRAAGYAIYQNGEMVARTFDPYFSSRSLMDNSPYQYQIFSLDDEGNRSDQPLHVAFKTNLDAVPPKVLSVEIQNLNTLILKFNEPLERSLATDIQNYRSAEGIEITSIALDESESEVKLVMTNHQQGDAYRLIIKQLRDRASAPNELKDYRIDYDLILKYQDRFDSDNLNAYRWEHIWEEGGVGSCHYDAQNRRMKVMTGDDVGERFSRSVPELDTGIFKIDFFPIQNYPTGGRLIVRLKQDDDTYYEVEKTHGFGAGHLKKVIQGATVDSTAGGDEFEHGVNYNMKIDFSPCQTTLSGFLKPSIIERNTAPITVKKIEIDLLQQDAFFDNIDYRSK